MYSSHWKIQISNEKLFLQMKTSWHQTWTYIILHSEGQTSGGGNKNIWVENLSVLSDYSSNDQQ